MQSEWLGMGPKTKQFENELCSFVGAKNSVAVNSGTSALITALLANGIRPGDEVILPAFTFIATVNSVLAIGAKPILVDCDPLTFNALANLISRTISEHPTAKAVIFVDVAGMPSDIDEMRELASKKTLFSEILANTIDAMLSNRENQTMDIVKMAPRFWSGVTNDYLQIINHILKAKIGIQNINYAK